MREYQAISESKGILATNAFALELRVAVDVKGTPANDIQLKCSRRWFAKDVKLFERFGDVHNKVKLNYSCTPTARNRKLKGCFGDGYASCESKVLLYAYAEDVKQKARFCDVRG